MHKSVDNHNPTCYTSYIDKERGNNMEKALLLQIQQRIELIDKKGEYDLSNALESLRYLMSEYNGVTFSKKVTFKEWYNEQKRIWLDGSGAVTDIDFWVGDVEELSNTDILNSDYELFDKYFNMVLDDIK